MKMAKLSQEDLDEIIDCVLDELDGEHYEPVELPFWTVADTDQSQN